MIIELLWPSENAHFKDELISRILSIRHSFGKLGMDEGLMDEGLVDKGRRPYLLMQLMALSFLLSRSFFHLYRSFTSLANHIDSK